VRALRSTRFRSPWGTELTGPLRAGPLWLAALLLAVGCASQSGRGMTDPSSASTGSTGADSATDDGSPTFSADEKKVLEGLSPPILPAAPEDVSNAYAGNAAAAALGKKLFSDPSFSGQLLDKDNDGGPNTLGTQGQTGRVSCSGCHIPNSEFLDTRSIFGEITLAAGWTKRRTPSLLDVGQAKIVMWGGRFSTLWSQPFGALENPLEMNTSRLYTAKQIAVLYKSEYEAVFGKGSLDPLADDTRFPALSADKTGCSLTTPVIHPRAAPPSPIYSCHGVPGDGAEYDGMKPDDQQIVMRVVANMGKAIAAYERGLVCGQGRFDRWVAGDATALTLAEQRGAKLFIGKGQCTGCHSGPFFSDQKFYNVGLAVVSTREGILNDNDHGAAVDLASGKSDPLGITGSYSDGNDGRLPDAISAAYEGAFRTPMLRCAIKRPAFMHTGTMHSLDEVVAFFSRGGDPSGYPGKSVLTPVQLIPGEMADLVAFLRSLDGPNASLQ
jgi:cytochrome c peroxidase